jgi:hypothetical protein
MKVECFKKSDFRCSLNFWKYVGKEIRGIEFSSIYTGFLIDELFSVLNHKNKRSFYIWYINLETKDVINSYKQGYVRYIITTKDHDFEIFPANLEIIRKFIDKKTNKINMRDLRYKLNEKRDNDRYWSPVRRDRSRSPVRRDRSRSPVRRDRSGSSYKRDRSRSPVRRDRSRSPVRRERYWSSPQRKDLDEKLHKDEKKEIKFYNDKQNDKKYRNFEKEYERFKGGYMPYGFMPQAFMPPGFPMGLPMNIPVGYPPGFPQYPMQNFNPRLYYGPPPDEEPPAPRSLQPPLETIKKSR